MNTALLAKWLWRLKTEKDCLWSKCIISCHNISNIDGKPVAKATQKGVWWNIVQVKEELSGRGICIDDLMKRRIGNGCNTYFWKDRWLNNMAPKDVFPELYNLEVQKDCRINQRLRKEEDNSIKCMWEWKRRLRRGK